MAEFHFGHTGALTYHQAAENLTKQICPDMCWDLKPVVLSPSMLCPFNTVPHVVGTLSHKIIFTATSEL